jgi:hypothetical protein
MTRTNLDYIRIGLEWLGYLRGKLDLDLKEWSKLELICNTLELN